MRAWNEENPDLAGYLENMLLRHELYLSTGDLETLSHDERVFYLSMIDAQTRETKKRIDDMKRKTKRRH